ncbi:hypothetical protein FZEAL_2722 [Fusarium zealandicum]|uniref:Uncharacterized protein n=1 Tax=Fusarium zealandicum TaxID=1053134 RepID=A0A8H4UQ48_9HYPO|nr:hypothetical protein FZEAL_2722 [Fusarium zealandicum]
MSYRGPVDADDDHVLAQLQDEIALLVDFVLVAFDELLAKAIAQKEDDGLPFRIMIYPQRARISDWASDSDRGSFFSGDVGIIDETTYALRNLELRLLLEKVHELLDLYDADITDKIRDTAQDLYVDIDDRIDSISFERF